MRFESGRRLGAFEILAPLGKGGMGEVYRARDTKLGREVAIKVLPETLKGDAPRLARFQREATLLAALNHPHIASIHGLEEADGQPFLVMELVSGEELAERIERGPIPPDEALEIARQIAEALEAAHEKGIVHRDLKPANVKVTSEGQVMVLDFGRAKAFAREEGDDSAAGVSQSPTMSRQMTEAGLILGTAGYMSPEQAKGKGIDRRSDVWAFGVVLFEMLAGKPAFEGESVSDTLASVLKSDPAWNALPNTVAPSIRTLLRHCLTKDPRDRLHDVADARISIVEALAGEDEGSESPTPRRGERSTWASVAAVLAVIALAAAYAALVGRDSSSSIVPTVRLEVAGRMLDYSTGTLPFALSPDGMTLVYVDHDGPATKLFVRRMDRFDVEALDGTEGAGAPFFSADGEWVGFFATNRLKKVALAGGRPIEICPVPHAPGGATWLEDDSIVFGMAFTPTGLYRVSADGGRPEAVTRPDTAPGEFHHKDPHALPGGRSVIFTVATATGQQVEVLSLDGGPRRVLSGVRGRARYMTGGYLLYGDSASLLAAPFDVSSGQITGPPVTALEGVRAFQGGAAFAISPSGALAYLPYAERGSEHVWVDRGGRVTPLDIEDAPGGRPVLSWDGRRLAITGGTRFRDNSFYIYDLERGGRVRFPGFGHMRWMPGDAEIAFSSRLSRSGASNLYRMRSDGSGEPELLFESEHNSALTGLSQDGQWILFYEQHPDTSRDIWALPLDGTSEARSLVTTPASDRSATFSPDGRWFAYTSNVSGRDEVYVRRFDPHDTSAERLISTDGGREPQWSRDGKELFYRVGRAMMAVPVELRSEFTAGEPRKLFEGSWGVESGGLNPMYDVAPDGQSFVMMSADEGWNRIRVVLGWQAELEQLTSRRDR